MKGSCRWCKVWNSPPRGSKQKIKDDNGKNPIYYYFCPIIRKTIKGETPACERLEITPWFYCKKKSMRTTAKVCLNNQIKRQDADCRFCPQGKELIDLVRGQREDPRKAPVFPNSKKEKPKLRRRNAR